MGTLLGVAAFLAVLLWLFFPRRRRNHPAPEDDVATPIEKEELEQAERELAEDARARPLGTEEVEDDWGPGAG